MRTASAPDSTSILSLLFKHGINLYGYLSPVEICLTLISRDQYPLSIIPPTHSPMSHCPQLYLVICAACPTSQCKPLWYVNLFSIVLSSTYPISVYIVNSTIRIPISYSSILGCCSLFSWKHFAFSNLPHDCSWGLKKGWPIGNCVSQFLYLHCSMFQSLFLVYTSIIT
jgi:hypothetical protein